jgi:phosphotransferase system HPr (HPr) family protein
VQLASRFTCRVTIKKGRKSVDGKSIMGLLTLAARPEARISIIADGPDAAEALERLVDLVTHPLSDSKAVSS